MKRLLAIAALMAFAPLGGCGAFAACFASAACTGAAGAGLGYAASVNNLGSTIINHIDPPNAAPAK